MYSESSTGYLGVLAGRDTIGPASPKQPSPADAQGSSGIKTHVHTLNASHFTWVTAVCVHEVGKALSLEAPPCQKKCHGHTPGSHAVHKVQTNAPSYPSAPTGQTDRSPSQLRKGPPSQSRSTARRTHAQDQASALALACDGRASQGLAPN